MTFKILKKSKSGLGVNQVSIRKTSVSFGSDFKVDKEYVEVYMDKENKKIAFKFTDNQHSGFKIDKRDSVLRSTVTKLARTIKLDVYDAKLEGDMIVIEDVEFL